ncbi:MAG: response regulator [candidate division Zixibacteria bacterium]|nr:response regulator [candidate division Zixibacteria bacterium]
MENILVVDDEEHLLNLYEEELLEQGYQVKLAKNRTQALEIVNKEKINLVVLDIKLSGEENGLQILSLLKEKNKNLPVIINSAYPSYKINFQTWLADAYLVKSSNLVELKEKIKQLLRG